MQHQIAAGPDYRDRSDRFRLTTNRVLSPAASLEIGDDLTSPRDLQRELWRPDRHDLVDELITALRRLVGDVPRASRRATLVDEHDVTALREDYHGPTDEFHYARLAAYSLESTMERARFIQTTRQLGGSTTIGINSSLEDVVDGPVAILATSDTEPVIEVDIGDLFNLKSTQRKALIRYLLNLTPGVRVRLTGSRLTINRLVRQHEEDLPASVIEAAKARLQGSSPNRTRTERVRGQASLLLDHLGADHVDLPRLARIADTPAARMSYDEVQAAVEMDLDGRDAVRAFARRMDDGHVESLLESDVDAEDLVDDDASIAERITVAGDTHVRLTALGEALVERWQASDDARGCPSSRGGWPTDNGSQRQTDDAEDADPEEAASDRVPSPPNPQHSTVFSQPAGEGGEDDQPADAGGDRTTAPDRPEEEAWSAAAGGSDGVGTLAVDTLDMADHHAAAAGAESGKVALCERPLEDSSDESVAHWSFDSDRDEIVVSVQASSKTALTMTRLCAALASPYALSQVLTTDRLAGSPDENGLGGLVVDNGHVLRKGACFGWLRQVDEEADRFRDRLRRARDELLAMTGDLDAGDGSLDEDVAGRVLRQAHGLHGVLSRVYDMLGVDVVREVKLPKWSVRNEDRRGHVRKMLGRACSIGGRYGVYSGYRVLYEDRQEKREDALGAPDVDAADPVGEIVGSWVLSGPTVTDLVDEDGDLGLGADLELQDGEANYAEFLLEADVVDANHRTSIATAVARLLEFKNLHDTRSTVSLLDALLGDVFAVAEVLHYLGQEDQARRLDYHDIRYGLSRLDRDDVVDKILPDLGGPTVSKVVHALADAERPLSTAEVAEIADVTTQSMGGEDNRAHFDVLEALGLLERDEQGPGKATLWRLTLPYRGERLDDDAPNPGVLVGEIDSTDPYSRIDTALGELFYDLYDDFGHDLGIDPAGELVLGAWSGPVEDRDLSPLLQERPKLRPWAELLVKLLDESPATLDWRLSKVWGLNDPGVDLNDGSLTVTTLGTKPSMASTQFSLEGALADH